MIDQTNASTLDNNHDANFRMENLANIKPRIQQYDTCFFEQWMNGNLLIQYVSGLVTVYS